MRLGALAVSTAGRRPALGLPPAGSQKRWAWARQGLEEGKCFEQWAK